MSRSGLQRVETSALPYLLSLPAGDAPASGTWPLLCFLHGYDEGAPMPMERALTRHGPLAASASPCGTAEFIVIAPQLPVRGDLWHRHADAVREIVRQVQGAHGTDPARTYLTGFSFGGNGVFDLALAEPELWAALWPVDPTRVPRLDPARPLWLSSGEISRHAARAFAERLALRVLDHGAEPGDRVYVDQAQDHVGTARLAYADDRIYSWLLARRLPDPRA
jgi:poly(3-hydroxybutyrate) depolymerase